MVYLRKIRRMIGFVHIALILGHINIAFSCSRTSELTRGEKIKADGRYVIKISGTSDKYEPGQKYSVSLMGIQDVSQSSHTFIGFFLTVENLNADPRNATDPSVVGSFELLDTTTTKFSEKCQHLITHTNILKKSKVEVDWTAPAPGSGCVLIRATVIENWQVWYSDDPPLTKELCEIQQDDIDNQPPILDPCCACDEAKYELIFEGKWSRHTHPKDFPADYWKTKFSDIIGASHTVDYRFWNYGEKASEGLKEVAEQGSTRKLESELKEQSDQIRTIIKARGLQHPNVTGKTFAVFRVDSKHHLISLVSMIHPSPDWIVGVSGLELCLPNCSWVEHKVHNLFPWDAGTDGGPSYLSSDEPESRPDVVRRIKPNFPNDPRSPFYDPTGAPMKPMARLHISRRRLYQKNCENMPSEKTPMECATHPWSKWSECSARCGTGRKYRTRQFKNPTIAVLYDCKNDLREEEDCHRKKCSGDEEESSSRFIPQTNDDGPECALSEWNEWSKCSATCGKGTRTRYRTYLNKKDTKRCQQLARGTKLQENIECDGESCGGDLPEEEPQEPPQCQVSDWSDWTPCSCETGLQSRLRTVWNADPMSDPDACSEIKTEEETLCTPTSCDSPPEYCYSNPRTTPCRGEQSGYWYYDYDKKECSVFYEAKCNKYENKNKFRSMERCLEICGEKTQPEYLRSESLVQRIDCEVSDWKIVQQCNATCRPGAKEGTRIKKRFVIKSPKNGGKACPKKFIRVESCNARCPNDFGDDYRRKQMPIMSQRLADPEENEDTTCLYSEWSQWSPCTATCGDYSFRQRTRTLLNTNLSYKCTDRVRTEKCRMAPCYFRKS